MISDISLSQRLGSFLQHSVKPVMSQLKGQEPAPSEALVRSSEAVSRRPVPVLNFLAEKENEACDCCDPFMTRCSEEAGRRENHPPPVQVIRRVRRRSGRSWAESLRVWAEGPKDPNISESLAVQRRLRGHVAGFKSEIVEEGRCCFSFFG